MEIRKEILTHIFRSWSSREGSRGRKTTWRLTVRADISHISQSRNKIISKNYSIVALIHSKDYEYHIHALVWLFHHLFSRISLLSYMYNVNVLFWLFHHLFSCFLSLKVPIYNIELRIPCTCLATVVSSPFLVFPSSFIAQIYSIIYVHVLFGCFTTFSRVSSPLKLPFIFLCGECQHKS